MRTRMRLTITGVIAALAATLAPAVANASPYCGIYWGSLEKTGQVVNSSPPQSITNVRAGRHDCFDRLVVDLQGGATYRVLYVSAVQREAIGGDLPLRGGSFLSLELQGVSPFDINTGDITYDPADDNELVGVSGWQTLRQVSWAGSFEAHTTIGVGVRGHLPFRVFALDGPGTGARLVLDVAHFW